MSFLESIQEQIGTVSDIVTKTADTYDRAMASFNPADDPYWYEGEQARKASEPPKSVGVEVAQAQPAGSSGLLVLAVLAILLFKVL